MIGGDVEGNNRRGYRGNNTGGGRGYHNRGSGRVNDGYTDNRDNEYNRANNVYDNRQL